MNQNFYRLHTHVHTNVHTRNVISLQLAPSQRLIKVFSDGSVNEKFGLGMRLVVGERERSQDKESGTKQHSCASPAECEE